MIQSKALPSRFRRARVALVGFGDVGQRILAQRTAVWQASPKAPMILAVARRTGWDLDQAPAARRLAARTQHWIVLVPPAEGGPQQTLDVRSIRLAQALERAGSPRRRRLVYISTTGVYGDYAGRAVYETDPLKTHQPRSLRRVNAEKVWRSARAHILRVPGIAAEDRLPLDRIRRMHPALRPEDDVYTNHVHADDLARLAWVALWRGRPGRVTNTVMRSHLRMGDYFDLVADTFGLPRCPRVSRAELEAAVGRGEISPMAASFMQDSRRVQGTRLAELRVALHYERIEDVIQSARSAHPQ